jgi:hypothetical protein
MGFALHYPEHLTASGVGAFSTTACPNKDGSSIERDEGLQGDLMGDNKTLTVDGISAPFNRYTYSLTLSFADATALDAFLAAARGRTFELQEDDGVAAYVTVRLAREGFRRTIVRTGVAKKTVTLVLTDA